MIGTRATTSLLITLIVVAFYDEQRLRSFRVNSSVKEEVLLWGGALGTVPGGLCALPRNITWVPFPAEFLFRSERLRACVRARACERKSSSRCSFKCGNRIDVNLPPKSFLKWGGGGPLWTAPGDTLTPRGGPPGRRGLGGGGSLALEDSSNELKRSLSLSR